MDGQHRAAECRLSSWVVLLAGNPIHCVKGWVFFMQKQQFDVIRRGHRKRVGNNSWKEWIQMLMVRVGDVLVTLSCQRGFSTEALSYKHL
jgi:hypothetical protein